MSNISSTLASVPPLLAANAEMLSRYDQLRQSADFGSVVRIGIFAPQWFYIQSLETAGLLNLVHALADADAGHLDRARDRLDEEIEFHRRLLVNSPNILRKMQAIKFLQEDFYIHLRLVEISLRTAGVSQMPAPPRLSPAELSLAAAMQDESATMFGWFIDAGSTKPDPWLEKGVAQFLLGLLPYKRNRTFNRMTESMMDIARASTLGAREIEEKYLNFEGRSISLFEWIINATGAKLIEGDLYHRYLLRVHDFDAYIVLVQVAQRLLEAGASRASVHGHLLALPSELRNPFDGTPPLWDNGVLRFEVRQPSWWDAIYPREVKLLLALPEDDTATAKAVIYH